VVSFCDELPLHKAPGLATVVKDSSNFTLQATTSLKYNNSERTVHLGRLGVKLAGFQISAEFHFCTEKDTLGVFFHWNIFKIRVEIPLLGC
jgi:hypothetical protein